MSTSYVLNIGSNKGQFAKLRYCGYLGDIISFEPSSAAYDKLLANARCDRHWRIYPRVAVGDSDSDTLLNLTSQSSLSSTLKPLGAGRFRLSELGCPGGTAYSTNSGSTPAAASQSRSPCRVPSRRCSKGTNEPAQMRERCRSNYALFPRIKERLTISTSSTISIEKDFALPSIPVTNRNVLGRMYQLDALLLRDTDRVREPL
jgi:hypothetical protein